MTIFWIILRPIPNSISTHYTGQVVAVLGFGSTKDSSCMRWREYAPGDSWGRKRTTTLPARQGESDFSKLLFGTCLNILNYLHFKLLSFVWWTFQKNLDFFLNLNFFAVWGGMMNVYFWSSIIIYLVHRGRCTCLFIFSIIQLSRVAG